MSSSSVESFWDFSVRTYRTSGVPDACLSLQDASGVDVNMFLYCCWLAARHGEIDANLWSDTIEFSTAWASRLVKPLRLARTWMKHEGCVYSVVQSSACMQLREKVKAVEFDAEKMQQEVLESLTPSFERNTSGREALLPTVVKNVSRYSHHLGLPIDSEVAEKITVIVSAAYPDLDRQEILSAFIALEST